MCVLDYDICPVCGNKLDTDTELYITKSGEIAGCEGCVTISYPVVVEEDMLLEQAADRYNDWLYDSHKEEREGIVTW